MTCRSCGAEIVWARSETGASLPVDAIPVPDGNLHLRQINVDDPPLAVRLSTQEIAGLVQDWARRVREGWEKEPFALHVAHSDSCQFWDQRRTR